MNPFIILIILLVTTNPAIASKDLCNDLSELAKHTYEPSETNTKEALSIKKWGIDEKQSLLGAKIDKNHLLYGKQMKVMLYCLENKSSICDLNNSWLPISMVKLSITKGKKPICSSFNQAVTLKDGKYSKESIFHFYTEK